jgi:Fur family transcriptional regulator, iron response regulator
VCEPRTITHYELRITNYELITNYQKPKTKNQRPKTKDRFYPLTTSKFRLNLNSVMKRDVVSILREHDIQPSAQRVAVAQYVLFSDEHPSADQVWNIVTQTFPMLSRATVYNTLNLFVEKGLLRELFLAEGKVVFDPKLETHHHFIDEATGQIHDIPWDKVQVCNIEALKGFEISDYQVVMRGRKKKPSVR